MKPQERYKQERTDIKQQRHDNIVKAAEAVIFRKGIEGATMNDIAAEANVGVATVFRYFPSKEKLVLELSAGIMEETRKAFESIAASQTDCLGKVEMLFDYFITMLETNRSPFVKFLEEMHLSMAHGGEKEEETYRDGLADRKIFAVFVSIIEEGTKDGSLRGDLPIQDVLITLVNAFGQFASKLAFHKNVLMLPSDVEPERQLSLVKEMMLDYIRPR
ncbi:TetR/AcrR family transcriptional regulator [Paenibacillus sp. LHD-117]|uniref:TetR/AcrR family transcriptional regulator n=1 Tax=Paenibacillus sp. LHD-117 TaxID=3071412 RepID=UPI0027E058EE|nr:TetR/AcrR family transcriptional regulator [Paenibacillus sp. LHD-117]MDQ6420612.1 TetR/AcrR family transcriptional regulator [Paenibacillus sp. LHD-117]